MGCYRKANDCRLRSAPVKFVSRQIRLFSLAPRASSRHGTPSPSEAHIDDAAQPRHIDDRQRAFMGFDEAVRRRIAPD